VFTLLTVSDEGSELFWTSARSNRDEDGRMGCKFAHFSHGRLVDDT
jgi:hypothetical protein